MEKELTKTATDAVKIVGLAAGIGWIVKKTTKESMLSDPSSSLANYAKWTAVILGSLYAKEYLEKQLEKERKAQT